MVRKKQTDPSRVQGRAPISTKRRGSKPIGVAPVVTKKKRRLSRAIKEVRAAQSGSKKALKGSFEKSKFNELVNDMLKTDNVFEHAEVQLDGKSYYKYAGCGLARSHYRFSKRARETLFAALEEFGTDLLSLAQTLALRSNRMSPNNVDVEFAGKLLVGDIMNTTKRSQQHPLPEAVLIGNGFDTRISEKERTADAVSEFVTSGKPAAFLWWLLDTNAPAKPYKKIDADQQKQLKRKLSRGSSTPLKVLKSAVRRSFVNDTRWFEPKTSKKKKHGDTSVRYVEKRDKKGRVLQPPQWKTDEAFATVRAGLEKFKKQLIVAQATPSAPEMYTASGVKEALEMVEKNLGKKLERARAGPPVDPEKLVSSDVEPKRQRVAEPEEPAADIKKESPETEQNAPPVVPAAVESESEDEE